MGGKPSTVAVRMRTALNARNRDQWRLYFDAEGHEVNAIFGPEAFGPRGDTYTHEFRTYREWNGRLHQWTAREIQEALDEEANRAAFEASEEGKRALAEMAALAEKEYQEEDRRWVEEDQRLRAEEAAQLAAAEAREAAEQRAAVDAFYAAQEEDVAL